MFEPSAEAFARDASDHSTLRWCSRRDSAWRSTLLRHYTAVPTADDVHVPPISDQVLILVTAGHAAIEASSDGGSWRGSHHVPGRLAMTAPGRSTRLRWRTLSARPHQTLQLYVAGSALQTVAARTWEREPEDAGLLDTLGTTDPLVDATLTALIRAARAGVDELYAESALQFLAVHLLRRVRRLRAPRVPTPRTDRRVDDAIAHLHAHLARPVPLEELARGADLSPFHFLRLFQSVTGQPPHRYLTGLRVAAAQQRLARSDATVSEIALLCGFSSPSHFAAVFRRWTGDSPSGYRQAVTGR